MKLECFDRYKVTRDIEIKNHAMKCGASKLTQFFALDDDGFWVGYVSLDINKDADYLVLNVLFMLERFRRQGYGRQAVQNVEAIAIDQGYKKVFVKSQPLDGDISRGDLVSWYMQQGYTERSDVKGGYCKVLKSNRDMSRTAATLSYC